VIGFKAVSADNRFVFGTSGIRGIYGTDITEDLASRIASIFAEKKLAIGRDIRESGPSLLRAAAEGASSNGADVLDLGIAPTPTVALAAKNRGCRAIMVTASHNPPQYNGLKLMDGGKEIGKGLEKEITRRYQSGERPPSGQAGSSGLLYSDGSAVEEHIQMIRDLVDAGSIARKKPKVVVDCNGAACMISPRLLTDLGCQVLSVNASEHCFNRPSEPNAANLAYLSSFIRDTGADFAIAHDGDGDRCIVLDERGEALQFDAQLALMMEHEMGISKGRKRIISTVEASLTVRDVVERSGGTIDITPVGSTFVGDALEESGALFGGEPCGEYIYRDGVHVPDAILAAAKFAEIFCAQGRFSEMKARYPQNHMAREKFPAKDKRASMEKIKGRIDIRGKLRSDDGIRVDEEDGWFLIRASGTEPIIRLTMEYKAKEKLEERKKKLVSLIRDAVI
jgi:phosphoglucosamine mutase